MSLIGWLIEQVAEIANMNVILKVAHQLYFSFFFLQVKVDYTYVIEAKCFSIAKIYALDILLLIQTH